MYNKMNLDFVARICIFVVITQLFHPNHCACVCVRVYHNLPFRIRFFISSRDIDCKVQPLNLKDDVHFAFSFLSQFELCSHVSIKKTVWNNMDFLGFSLA
jgi:hypothetical protein